MMKILKVLGYIWCSPLSLVGLLLSILYRPQSIRWHDGTIQLVAGTKNGSTRLLGKPGAQSLGCVVWYASDELRNNARLAKHEKYHVYQSMVGSIFFSLAYATEWAVRYVANPSTPAIYPRWKRAYYNLSWERKAREYSLNICSGLCS